MAEICTLTISVGWSKLMELTKAGAEVARRGGISPEGGMGLFPLQATTSLAGPGLKFPFCWLCMDSCGETFASWQCFLMNEGDVFRLLLIRAQSRWLAGPAYSATGGSYCKTHFLAKG